jgi:hypothetical protein
MALPKIDVPVYDITLPVSNKEISFRPFLVKEEKVFLVAKEGDQKAVVNAVKQIITNCVVKPSNFNPKDLTMTDIEYLFIQLRARSVNNIVELKYRDKEDKQVYEFQLDLDEIGPTFNPKHENKIMLNDKIGVVMREPTLGAMEKINFNNLDSNDNVWKVVGSCIESAFDDEQVYDDFNQKEVEEFVKQMDLQMFERIKVFFDTMPKLSHTIEYKNSEGTERKIVLQGIQDFF